MHYLGFGSHPYPVMPFASARTQDTGLTWADLQPRGSWFNTDVLARLDNMVKTFKSRGVQPLIVLGMTPRWARASCHHGSWPADTCGPRSTGTSSPWGKFVRAMAHRYHGVYFEVWNEPNLKNGYNDSIAKMARLQSTAYTVIHGARTGDRLVSPTVAITAGNPLGWLKAFFRSTGGKRFDVFGLHLYPSDYSARHGYGPEWSIKTLGQVRSILRANRISKPIWDTEANVGRYQERRTTSRTFTGWAAAGVTARLYVLQLAANVQRIFWYAADDRTWGGTWMEAKDYKTLTYAGRAERTAYNLLVHARNHGCTHTDAGNWNQRYTCKFHLANGKNMLVKWTTRGHYYTHAPAHSSRTYTAVGGATAIHGGSSLKITTVPLYIVGSFRL
jgi:Glycosyl hydrolase catalytic core